MTCPADGARPPVLFNAAITLFTRPVSHLSSGQLNNRERFAKEKSVHTFLFYFLSWMFQSTLVQRLLKNINTVFNNQVYIKIIEFLKTIVDQRHTIVILLTMIYYKFILFKII